MKKCLPLYAFVTMVFIAHITPMIIRHNLEKRKLESFVASQPQSEITYDNFIDHLNRRLTHNILRAALYYIVVCYAIYESCVRKIEVNPSWFIVILYVIWVFLELFVGLILTLASKIRKVIRQIRHKRISRFSS